MQSNPAFLGIGLGQMANSGCFVESVIPGGAAADAGLQAGDSILAIDLVPLQSPDKINAAKLPCDQLLDIVKAHQPGDRIRLDLARGANKLVEHVTLTSRSDVWQRRVGERMETTDVVDVDDARHRYEIGRASCRERVYGPV